MDIQNIITEKNKELNKDYKYDKETWISVSNIKDSIKTPFDREGVAAKTSAKYFNDQSSIYYKMSAPKIVEMWQTKANNSINTGHLCDDYIKLIYEHRDNLDGYKSNILLEHEDMKNRFIGIDGCLTDLKNNGFKFECRELKLMLPYKHKKKTYIINGRFDALFSFKKDDIEKLIIIDWKNSEEIKTMNNYQKLLGPCKDFDDCDLNLFTIQVYLYRYMLEKVYGVTMPILTYIIQFPGNKDYYYKIFQPPFDYNEKMIEKIIKFSVESKIEKESN